MCEEGPGFRVGGWIWRRQEQGGKPQGREDHTAAPSPPCFAYQHTSFSPGSCGVDRSGERGNIKGKVSQDPGCLYLVLPEQGKGGEEGMGPRRPALPDVGVMTEKKMCSLGDKGPGGSCGKGEGPGQPRDGGVFPGLALARRDT